MQFWRRGQCPGALMNRRLLAALLMMILSEPALARTVEERLISGLKSQGYVILEDGFTWLGRLRVVAENAQYHREIVVNPETGEVLRDYVVLLADMPAKQAPSNSGPSVASSQGGDGSSTISDGGVSVLASTMPTLGPDPQATETLAPDAAAKKLTDAASDDLLLADPVISTGSGTP